ncbi:MAG: phenylacetate--CoA ligase family protein [Actinomycetota bacterium]
MPKQSWHALDRDELIRLRDRKLRKQIRFQLYAYSPFYRHLLDELGLQSGGFEGIDDLKKLPLIDRTVLARDPEAFVLAPSRALLQRWGSTQQLVEAVMAMILRGEDSYDRGLQYEYRPVHVLESSGTTGEPLPIRLTRRDLAVLAVHGSRMFEVAGLEESDVLLNLMEPISAGGFWAIWAGAVGRGLQHLAPGILEPENSAALALKMRATALAARAEDALAVFEAAGEGRALPELKTILLAPEQVGGALRRRLAERAGPDVRIISSYGFAEGRAVLVECAEGAGRADGGYHSAGDVDLIETVSLSSGAPVANGETGEIVFTGLDHRGTALARYRPGDVAIGGLKGGPCPYCGRNTDRVIGPIRRTTSLLSIQPAGADAVAVDLEGFSAALAHPQLASWRVEVVKTEGDPRGPDEVYVMFRPARGRDPGELAVELDRALRTEVGIAATQFVLGETFEEGVADLRPVPAGPVRPEGEGGTVRLWRSPPGRPA